MDIRVQAYGTPTRPVSVTSFSRSGNLPATAVAQNSAQSGPVPAVAPVQPNANALTQNLTRQFASSGPGQLVDIYA